MLVQCPKCNFTQPKDVYCAKCGVNMETYKSTPVPLLQKIIKHPISQLGFLIVFVIFGVSSYRIYQNKVLQDRLAFFKGDRNIQVQIPKSSGEYSDSSKVALSNTNSANPTVDESNQNLIANNNQNTKSENLDHPNIDKNENLNNGNNPNNVTNGNTNSNNNSSSGITPASGITPTSATTTNSNRRNVASLNSNIKFNFHYVEVTRSDEKILKSLAMQESNYSETNEAYFGLISSPFSKIIFKNSEVLQQQSPLIENGSANWFLGSVDPSDITSAIGMNSLFSNIVENQDSEYSGLISFSLTTKDGADFSGELIKKNLETEFHLKKGQTYFIGGFFPPLTSALTGHEWLKTSFMKVLFSPKFQKNQSTVLIFFEISEDSQ